MKYRIVKDNFALFEVQAKRWWFPFWFQCQDGIHPANTYRSLENAKAFIEKRKNKDKSTVVWKE